MLRIDKKDIFRHVRLNRMNQNIESSGRCRGSAGCESPLSGAKALPGSRSGGPPTASLRAAPRPGCGKHPRLQSGGEPARRKSAIIPATAGRARRNRRRSPSVRSLRTARHRRPVAPSWAAGELRPGSGAGRLRQKHHVRGGERGRGRKRPQSRTVPARQRIPADQSSAPERQCNLFLSQNVVSFLLDAQWSFPYISANEKADGCKKTGLPVFKWVIDEEG